MKKALAVAICFATITLLLTPQLHSDDQIKNKILKLFPQADANGDGVLSESAVSYTHLTLPTKA